MFDDTTMLDIFRYVQGALDFLSVLFVFAVGLAIMSIPVLYVLDRAQSQQAIRRNYPVVGRFRYYFETLGEFFRQYFFAMDREEMPFNRAERSWIYKAAKNKDTTQPFGSTHTIRSIGSNIFANSMYPVQEQDSNAPAEVTIGPDTIQPYTTRSIYNVSGMSYGALSKPAVLALSAGARMAGSWQNTGEGGMSPYHVEGGADIVFQIGTGKFGVRNEDGTLSAKRLKQVAKGENVRMFEIKLSQGAKPGKGGILPAAKVTDEIARIRAIEPGSDCYSPNRHTEIRNINDMLEMIARVRDITGKPVGIKFVMGQPTDIDDFCEAVIARGWEYAPDFITLDGGEGGTGAAPLTLIDNVGMPVTESLPYLIDSLDIAGLRPRIKVAVAGKLVNPVGVAWALCIGADFVNSARGFMFALGCIQALRCHENTCPTGITTHNKRLQKGLNPESKAVRVANYIQNMTKEVEVIARSCGVDNPRSLRRHHVRRVKEDGVSVAWSSLYQPIKSNGDEHRVGSIGS